MNAEWFNMNDLKRHIFDNKVWVPLYAKRKLLDTGEVGHEGFREEYFDAHAVIVPQDQKSFALQLQWMDVTVGFGHKPWMGDDKIFHSATSYERRGVNGSNPVLVQRVEVERKHIIHVNQDLILALGLQREGDVWVCPEEDYVEVIKLIRDADEELTQVEIKAEFLKDYLCASNSGMILLSYQSRQAIEQTFDYIKWGKEEEKEKTDLYHWTGRLIEVREGSFPFNEAFHVLHAGRTDTDFAEDIPVYGFPSYGNTFSTSFNVKPTGRKLLRAVSEIWKKEWITPAAKSSRVRGDEVVSNIEFIVDNSGKTETSQTLCAQSRWLWFHPSIVNDLLSKRSGRLVWCTGDTGNVGGAWNRSVHFGVNSIGLINVYAKDIAELQEIDKKTWASHNVSPEGRVSAELLLSQMQALKADTIAPEEIFFLLVDKINNLIKSKLGRDLFRNHSAEKTISKNIHRFHAKNLDEFYSLCKEITRFLIERIDIDFLKKVKEEQEDKLGSLKRLEKILTALGYDGGAIMGTLVGVYKLRNADAHLPSTEDISNSMRLVGVDYETSKLNSGKKLIENVNASLEQIREAFDKGDFTKVKTKVK